MPGVIVSLLKLGVAIIILIGVMVSLLISGLIICTGVIVSLLSKVTADVPDLLKVSVLVFGVTELLSLVHAVNEVATTKANRPILDKFFISN